jgi:hypothetical protein
VLRAPENRSIIACSKKEQMKIGYNSNLHIDTYFSSHVYAIIVQFIQKKLILYSIMSATESQELKEIKSKEVEVTQPVVEEDLDGI